MDIIALETDSLTSKAPDNMYHTLCFMKKHPKCMTSFGGLFGILPIKKRCLLFPVWQLR